MWRWFDEASNNPTSANRQEELIDDGRIIPGLRRNHRGSPIECRFCGNDLALLEYERRWDGATPVLWPSGGDLQRVQG